MTSADEHDDEGPSLDLVARATAHDEELGKDVAAMHERVEELERDLAAAQEDVESLTDRLQRTQADFQNYKKRAKKRQEEAKQRATQELVERLLEVGDNLTRALEDESDDLESLKEGVRMTRNEFDRVLDAEDVTKIEPAPGTAVDPQRHEVMMTIESEEPEDTIASVYRPGYEMGDTVLRTAQVTVSEGPGDRESADNTEEGIQTDSEGA
ncbi:MAG: nucleotide exchange factor GrpE [Halanaeroarchaeum sp.]